MRINIDLEFLADKRVDRLARLCAEEKFTTIGRLIYLYAKCYINRSSTMHEREIDLHADWIGIERLATLMVDSGLAEPADGGKGFFKLSGIEERIQFLLDASDKGKRSAAARQKKYGTAQPVAKNTEQTTNTCSGELEDTPNRLEDLTLTPALSLTQNTKERPSVGSDTLREPLPPEDGGQGALLPEEVRPRPARPPKKQSEVQIFIGTYVTAWREKYGDGVSPIDDIVAGQIKNFLRGRNIQECCLLVQAYLQMDDPWFRKLCHDFTTFTKHLTKVKAALGTGKQDPTEEDLADFIRRKELERAGSDNRLLPSAN